MCECLRAWFHITVSYSKLYAALPRQSHSSRFFAACIPRQPYNGQRKLEKPLFLLHARCGCVSGFSLHERHPLRAKQRALWDVGNGGKRERKSKRRRLEWKRWRACCSFVSHLLLGLSCPLPACPACWRNADGQIQSLLISSRVGPHVQLKPDTCI